MKVRLLGLCCAMSLGLIASAAIAQPLKIGLSAEPYPPFYEKSSNGQWAGFEIDVLNSLCQRIKAQCEVTEVSWDGIIPSLQSKKIDVIFSSMSITPEREKVIAFSQPYYYTDSMFVGAKGVKVDLSPAGLSGKTIGVQSSTTNATFVMKHYGATANIKYYNTQDELSSDMEAGRIDVMLLDGLAASDLLDSKQGAQLESKGLAPRDPVFGPGIGAGLRKQDIALKKQFDQAIEAILSDGTFKKIETKYFKVDVAPK